MGVIVLIAVVEGNEHRFFRQGLPGVVQLFQVGEEQGSVAVIEQVFNLRAEFLRAYPEGLQPGAGRGNADLVVAERLQARGGTAPPGPAGAEREDDKYEYNGGYGHSAAPSFTRLVPLRHSCAALKTSSTVSRRMQRKWPRGHFLEPCRAQGLQASGVSTTRLPGP